MELWPCALLQECSSHIVRVLRMQRKLKILEGWTLKCFCFNRGGREQHYKAKTEQCWDGKGDGGNYLCAISSNKRQRTSENCSELMDAGGRRDCFQANVQMFEGSGILQCFGVYQRRCAVYSAGIARVLTDSLQTNSWVLDTWLWLPHPVTKSD